MQTNDITNKYKSIQHQIFTKQNTPLTKTYEQNTEKKEKKSDHSQLGSINPKFHLKIDHSDNYNPKYQQLCIKKKERKEKGQEKKVGTIILG